MPGNKSPREATFTACIMRAGKPTKSGSVYPLECLRKIADAVNSGKKKLYVEDLSPAERTISGKSIPVHNNSLTMADAMSAEVTDDGSLNVTFRTRPGAKGKMLQTAISQMGVNYIKWFPVGIGETDSKGNVIKYAISYVSFELGNAPDKTSSGVPLI